MSGGRPATKAERRWRSLPPDAPRDEYFAALHDVLKEYYLSEPRNPYRQSGRGSGARRWEESRRPIAEAVHRDGDFLDVGCANGLLLESLLEWCAARGHRIRPHGIDLIPELVDLARARHPRHASSFETANAWYWEPRRTYAFVRTELVYVPARDRAPYVRRLLEKAVAPRGRLIVCAYWGRDERPLSAGHDVRDLGWEPAGGTEGPGVSVAWLDRHPAP